ncbi:hypothetical protein H0H81_007226 [Sphagnurus paluster]|uniref:Protein BCP1 n=1 Tax=Sphagnurus paluster TaxID=117069 RepID=A0A9P7GQX2_9AGAR|nr:hypothetical protein H0H81_007226 [Sphagnurus paluster]
MPKRKESHPSAGDESDASSSDVSLIDVSFDFFDPNPRVDYHAIKRLLAQLFQRDAELFHLHDLVELVLAQPTVGTTVKTDGLESDPYALLTVLNMHVHQAHPSISALAHYALEKASSDAAFHSTLQQLFKQPETHVGLVLSERLVNMPVQVVPPMYAMLEREVGWALADNEPYRFTHYLILTRTYRLSPDEESALANSAPVSSKKAKKTKKARSGGDPSMSVGSMGMDVDVDMDGTGASADGRAADGVYPFHPEDAVIRAAAQHSIDYRFSKSAEKDEPRAKDAFGLDTRGRMMLVSADRWPVLVQRLGELYAVLEGAGR